MFPSVPACPKRPAVGVLSASRGLVVVAVSACAAAPAHGQPRAARSVLVLHTESSTQYGVGGAARGIQSRLTAPELRLDFYPEYLDLSWGTDPEYVQHLRALLQAKHAKLKFDVVIVVGTEALRFAAQNRTDLFPGTPIVFCVVTRAGIHGLDLSKDLTGVITTIDASATLEAALQLQPDARRAVVVGGTSSLDDVFLDEVKRELDATPVNVEVSYLRGLTLEALQDAVAQLPPRTVVLFVSMMRDGRGRALSSMEALRAVGPGSAAPVYGVFDGMIGQGIVGGRVGNLEAQGAQAADIALRLLSDPARVGPIESSVNSFVFDAAELRRWGLRESDVPAGSVLVNRAPSAWDLYRWYIVGAATLLALQGLTIASLVIQRSRRHEVEARHAGILQAMPDMMFLLDREGVYVDFYAPDHTRLLVEPDRFLGRHMRDVLPQDLAREFEDRFARLVPGKAPEIIEYSLPMPQGLCHFEARMVPVPGNRVLAIVRDITERVRAEAVLHEAQVELRRASRLSALGEFAATIAHELHQPLTAIVLNARGCLTGIAQPTADLDDARAGLLEIVEASQRAEEVIQRNRRLFRDHIVDAAPLDINGVIREALGLAASRLQDTDVTLVTALADDLPTVAGDRIELQQVLLNLVANAIDALESVEGGSRRIHVSSSLAGDQTVTVAVSDNGVGLRDVDVERIFLLSYTTKPTGTGVGLSISRSIVEAHGGRLWAEQNADGGATFYFSVPTRPAVSTKPSAPHCQAT